MVGRAQLQSVARAYLMRALVLDELRAAMVDSADDIATAPEQDQTLYGSLWERLSEFDYGHIDEHELRRQIAELVDASAPLAEVSVRHSASYTASQTGTRWLHLSLNARFSPATSQPPSQNSRTAVAGLR